jgi:DivIVA domain-containing protein
MAGWDPPPMIPKPELAYRLVVLSARRPWLPGWRGFRVYNRVRSGQPPPGAEPGPPAPPPTHSHTPEAKNVAEDDGPATAQEMAEMVRTAKFRTTRLQPGYDEEQVDNFLDEIAETLAESRPLDPALVRAAVFSTTRVRPGYAQEDVNALLDKVACYAESAGS